MDVSDSEGGKWKLEECRGEIRTQQGIRRRHKGETRGQVWMRSVRRGYRVGLCQQAVNARMSQQYESGGCSRAGCVRQGVDCRQIKIGGGNRWQEKVDATPAITEV